MRYVAFLRGVNSGRNPVVKMGDLQAAVVALGFRDVSTVLASGNVVFDARRQSEARLERALEPALSSRFGYTMAVNVLGRDALQDLADRRPFARVKASPGVRPHVTFLKTPADPDALPASRPGFTIVGVVDRAILSVIDLSGRITTPDVMRLFDRAFGKQITTRNWNTIERILRVSS
jgi:uncharacterized protein (DUF1697 family)